MKESENKEENNYKKIKNDTEKDMEVEETSKFQDEID